MLSIKKKKREKRENETYAGRIEREKKLIEKRENS